MRTNEITPIIMAGGSGTRLWPKSREDLPKQFCDLGFQNTLFQESLLRVQNDTLFDKPVIVCSRTHESIVRLQAEEVKVELGSIICEPVGRNTTAAIALAASANRAPGDSLFMVMASDHKINNIHQFHSDIDAAVDTVRDKKRIVLFGIQPSAPETGYGYVRFGGQVGSSKCMDILEFIEKPNSKIVELLVQDSTILWNSGMFFFRKDVVLQELEKYAPDVLRQVGSALSSAIKVGTSIYPDADLFAHVPDISFDYSVMENTNAAAITKMHSPWSDLGNWKAIWENNCKSQSGNTISGPVIDHESNGCLLNSDGPVIGTCGLEDIVIIANRDAVLVAHKDKVQGVKELVGQMKTERPELIKSHASENRPWGRFESLDRGPTHQVKRITVTPGGQLSLQYHFHRSEHWIVVSGIATVTVNKEVFELTAGKQVFIPQGAVHRLENFTDEPVELIEVQYGTYFGEDDIVRVEDVYNRPEKESHAA